MPMVILRIFTELTIEMMNSVGPVMASQKVAVQSSILWCNDLHFTENLHIHVGLELTPLTLLSVRLTTNYRPASHHHQLVILP